MRARATFVPTTIRGRRIRRDVRRRGALERASAPEPTKPDEGTSELDRQDDEKDDDSTTVKRSHRHAAAKDTSAKTDAAVTTPGDDVVQSTAMLDPEMQAKLARVMSRMRDETGQNVQVAETFRSQDRQNVLFAQGRDTPGPVVTWTQNSKHTQGRAADLVLGGGGAGSDAYTTLQRIANEEGLRTLGASDPGHVELPGASAAAPTSANSSVANDATSLIPVAPADASGPGLVSIARLAQVAQVAQLSVAQPAEVAHVASVARVAVPGTAATGGTDAGTPNAPLAKHLTTQNGQSVSPTFSGGSSTDASTDEQSDGGKGDQRGGYGALAAAVAASRSLVVSRRDRWRHRQYADDRCRPRSKNDRSIRRRSRPTVVADHDVRGRR